jgi:glycosyltransferase involved in cell wall biosynthesis
MADRVVAPTRAMLAALATHHGVQGGQVIQNGRSAAEYRPGPKQPFVLCAGRLWDEAKNVGALVRVAPRLPWPVQIAGALARDGERTRPPGGVTWVGPLPSARLAALMREAAIHVAPARYEPFGLTTLEAALSGCALVLGDIPSQRELWRGAALFVPPDDEGALEVALRALIESPELRAGWARRARRRARLYSARRMIGRYLALYRQMLGAAGAFPGEVQTSCAS